MTLDPEASGRQRDELLVEVAAISSFDDAAEWAKRIIPIKNTLTAEHAREVEAALEAKLGQMGNVFGEPPQTLETSTEVSKQQPNNDATTLATADRSTLTIGHAPRRRNKAHLKFVAAQPCLLCGRRPSDAHHLRFAQVQALGRKVSDEFTVPLCRTHHRQLHRGGNEVEWWEAWDPRSILWKSPKACGSSRFTERLRCHRFDDCVRHGQFRSATCDQKSKKAPTSSDQLAGGKKRVLPTRKQQWVRPRPLPGNA